MVTAMLIFVPVIFIIVAAAIRFIGPGVTRRLHVRVNYCIAGVYIAVLLLLSVSCLAIPSSALKPELRADEAAFFHSPGTLDTNLKAGIFEAPDGITRTDWSFVPASDHVTVVRSDKLPLQTYIGTKGAGLPDNGSRTIDVYFYTRGDMTYKGMTFTAPPSMPDVALDGSGTLFIKPTAGKIINIYEFDDRATIPQFTGVDTTHSNWSSSATMAMVVLVPPGMTVEGAGCVTLPISASQ